jgi:hypothetical protein
VSIENTSKPASARYAIQLCVPIGVSNATSAGVPAPCTKSTTLSAAGAPRSATPALTRSRT